MGKSIIYIGLDVHKDTYSVCSYLPEKDLLFSQTKMKASCENVMRYIKKVSQANDGALTLCGYEAGPTGLKLCRDLKKGGMPCVVMAPTSIGKTAKDKAVKTDKSDAIMLAKALAYHSYRAVVLPSENIEAIKQIVRLRDCVQTACKRAKQNFLSFLLVNGMVYPFGGRSCYWSQKFMEWLKTITFASAHLNYCKEEYEAEVIRLIQRLDELNEKVRSMEEDKEIGSDVKKLKCICGIDTQTAVSIKAEVGDFNRFKTAKNFANYTGLCPGKHSSGLRDKGTGITRQGNCQIRRLLIESTKAIRRSSSEKSRALLKRQEGADSAVINYADKAKKRIRRRLFALEARGMNCNKAATACARELSCFIWGMLTGHTA